MQDIKMNKEKLQEILTTANFDTLIGQIENDWFDCKGQPYQLQNDSGKRELAKDVSSFANTDGGFIFIGVKTTQSDQHYGDEVESLRPFPQALVNTGQYRDVIRAWIYPEIEGIDIQWIEIAAQPGKGLVVITVPKQKDLIKPFLITKTLDGKKQVEMVFGYAQRKGDASQPLTVADLQNSLRSGLHYEEQLKEQLDGIEIILKNSIEHNQSEAEKKGSRERIEKRIESTLEHDDMKNKRIIAISAYPSQPSQLKTIFLTTDGSIRKHLENPPTLRYGGWSIETLDQARIMRGEMIRVTNGDRKVVDLYRDGALVFAGLADHRFLAWHNEHKQKINPAAIIEIIYGFVQFYKLVLEDFKQPPQGFILRVDFKNLHLDGVKSYLVPYQLNSIAQTFDDGKMDAPDNEGVREITFSTENFDSGAIAYDIVKEVYLWFGIEENKIPYTKEENGLKVIDAEAIRNLSK